MNNLQPTPIIDKNGVATLRHKKISAQSSNRVPSMLPKTDILQRWKDGVTVPKFPKNKKFTDYTRSGNEVKITAGVIDRTAVSIFTRGQCMALAQALANNNAGIPVVAYEKGTRYLSHALIRLPDDSLLDITGVHDSTEVEKKYDLKDFDIEEFSDHVDHATGFAELSDPPNYEMAASFIGSVIALVKTD